jgi:PKD repeat protein
MYTHNRYYSPNYGVWSGAGVNSSRVKDYQDYTFTQLGKVTISLKTKEGCTGSKDIFVRKETLYTINMPEKGIQNTPITLEVTSNDGTIPNFLWKIDGKVEGQGARLTHTFTKPGKYSIFAAYRGTHPYDDTVFVPKLIIEPAK